MLTEIPLSNQYPSGGRWIVADLHVHSHYSGGSLTPPEILQMANFHLMDAIAITDHDNFSGGYEGQALSDKNPKLPLTVIGQEISAGNHFHFLMLGGTGASEEKIHRSKLAEEFAIHRESGGVVILAHPWTMPKNTWTFDFLKELIENSLLDAVEMMNVSILEQNFDTISWLKGFWNEWVTPFHLGITGGSDFHYHRQGRTLGNGRTYLKVFLPGAAGVLEAIRNRRCIGGLFHYRPFQLDWIGSGNQTLIGPEPWLTELKGLKNELIQRITQHWFLKPDLQKNLLRIMEMGHYSLVLDILGS